MKIVKPIVSIAEIITRDHDLLAGLADNDHTQYVLRSILTANGDIFIRSGGVIARLAIGSAGQLLGVSAGLPAYQTVGVPIPILKTADQTVNNSTTLVNDNLLLTPVGINEVWSVYFYLIMSAANATPNIKFAFTTPVAGVFSWIPSGDIGASGSGVLLTPYTTGPQAFTLPLATRHLLIWGVYVGGANAGNLQLQWAQNVANASDTKVLTNSHIIPIRVG